MTTDNVPPTPPTPPTPPAPDAPKTFTQEDVDRIVSDRLARAKTAAPADYDDLKAKAAKFDEIAEANKSELQRAQDAAAAADLKAKAAEERASAALRRAAVVAAAQRAGAIDPDAVLALLPQDQVTVADDGRVTGVDEAVTALLATKPYLVGKPTPLPGGADGGPRGGVPVGQLSQTDLKSMTPEEIVEAKSKGQLNDLLGVK